MQRNLIRDRQAFLAKLPMNQHGLWLDWDWAIKTGQSKLTKRPVQTISLVRKLLGDRAYYLIILPEALTASDIEEANALFPETDSIVQDSSGDSLIYVKKK
jgi:hypothetical protein